MNNLGRGRRVLAGWTALAFLAFLYGSFLLPLSSRLEPSAAALATGVLPISFLIWRLAFKRVMIYADRARVLLGDRLYGIALRVVSLTLKTPLRLISLLVLEVVILGLGLWAWWLSGSLTWAAVAMVIVLGSIFLSGLAAALTDFRASRWRKSPA